MSSLTDYALFYNQQHNDILMQIADITGVQHNDTVESFVASTQQSWLRKKGIERWQIRDTFADKKDLLMPLLKALGFCETVYPKSTYYTYGLMLGDMVVGLHGRLLFVKELINRSVRFEQFVLLTGKRMLTQEEIAALSSYLESEHSCKTETEAFVLLVKKFLCPGSTPIVLIDTPAVYEQGQLRRPTTADTVNRWIETKPQPGSCLALSSQPFLPYQHLTLKEILPADFTIETCGPVDPETDTVAIYLDSLARWLYQEWRLTIKKH